MVNESVSAFAWVTPIRRLRTVKVIGVVRRTKAVWILIGVCFIFDTTHSKIFLIEVPAVKKMFPLIFENFYFCLALNNSLHCLYSFSRSCHLKKMSFIGWLMNWLIASLNRKGKNSLLIIWTEMLFISVWNYM